MPLDSMKPADLAGETYADSTYQNARDVTSTTKGPPIECPSHPARPLATLARRHSQESQRSRTSTTLSEGGTLLDETSLAGDKEHSRHHFTESRVTLTNDRFSGM